MARTAAVPPYTPAPVPSLTLPDGSPDPEGIKNLQRFLREEHQRIQNALVFVPVQAAYAEMALENGPAADQPLPEANQFVGIEGYDTINPALVNRVVGSLTPDDLQVIEAGVFFVYMNIVATIASGTEYILDVAINGQRTALGAVIDASNQTSVITLTAKGILVLEAGDRVTVRGQANGPGAGPHTFIMESGTTGVFRISEEHRE